MVAYRSSVSRRARRTDPRRPQTWFPLSTLPENPHFIVVIRPVSSTARRLDRFSLCLLPSLRLLLKCGFCAWRTALSARHDRYFGELSSSQNDDFIRICDYKYLHGRMGHTSGVAASEVIITPI